MTTDHANWKRRVEIARKIGTIQGVLLSVRHEPVSTEMVKAAEDARKLCDEVWKLIGEIGGFK